MKQILFLLVAVVLLGSCAKQNTVEEPIDKWNGYYKYLKAGEMVKTLWAGKNINVGTVTYGITDNAEFYATYDCSPSGWVISETHMYAGDKLLMPLNKPGSPKTGHFPNSGYHSPRVSSFTYTVPLSSLPPCAEPGFVVASHCVVHSPANQEETAWAEGDYKFTDKDWGWYDVYFYNQPPNKFTILYGIAYDNEYLKLYHIDVTNNTSELIMVEYVGNTPGAYDGAAYDVESSMFFYTKDNTILMANDLNDVEPSFVSGSLYGEAASGTFHNGDYYYVDLTTNTIHQVSFNDDWTVQSDIALSYIPNSIAVNDIAIDLNGTYMYLVGTLNGNTVLIRWDIYYDVYNTVVLNPPLTDDVQIAFGDDGNLYGIAPGAAGSMAILIDLATGTLTPIDDDVIIILDDFSDISAGPIM